MKATNTLFGESIRKRPKRGDEEIAQLAAEMVVDRLLSEHRGDFKVQDRQSLIEDVMDVVGTGDAYQMARALEDSHGWAVDKAVVDTLDYHDIWDAERELVKRWVKAEGIEPSLKVGDVVMLRTDRGSVEGTIERICYEEATYTVNVRAFGHVDLKADQATRERSGSVIGTNLPYERVEEDATWPEVLTFAHHVADAERLK